MMLLVGLLSARSQLVVTLLAGPPSGWSNSKMPLIAEILKPGDTWVPGHLVAGPMSAPASDYCQLPGDWLMRRTCTVLRSAEGDLGMSSSPLGWAPLIRSCIVFGMDQ